MQMQGRKDGETIVKLGEGAMFKKMDEWNESTELKNQYPRLANYLRHVFDQLRIDEQDKIIDDHINNVKSST